METTTPVHKPRAGSRMSNESFITLFMLGILVIVFGLACVVVPNFYQPQNIVNLLTNNWYTIVVGIGVTFLLITGNFDMSVGGVIALTGVLSVYFSQGAGWSTVSSSPASRCRPSSSH
jgi:ribose/xylose/arabinose/galactoside ABC-type transport system permease subunit